MSAELKNIIILGAGGNLGPSILEALDTDPYFTVSVLSRKGSSSTFPDHIKVHQIDDTYPEDQLLAAFKGQDGIVLLLPPNEVEKQKKVIDAGIKAGVRRFIPGEFGSNTTKQELVDAVPIFAGKVEVTQYLKSKEDTGLSWTAIINGGFFDWGLKTEFLGFDLNSHSAILFDEGKTLTNYTLLSTVGKTVALSFKKPTITANKYLYINSYRASQLDLLAALEKATGGEKWKVTHKNAAATQKEGFEKLSKGDFSGIVDLLQAIIFGQSLMQDYSTYEELANEKIGLPEPEPLDEVVAKIVKGEKV